MTVNIEISELAELLQNAAETGATRALEKAGNIGCTTTYIQAVKQYGITTAKEARMHPAIKWLPRANGGKRAGVYCRTSDLERFMFERKFSFNK